jgi:ATP-dependent Clp protease ATP-binding subunit ClpC
MGFAPETAENNHELLKEKLLAESKRTFRPELLNRFDETVVFSALDKEAVAGILKRELSKLAERVEGAGVKFRIDKKAIEFLVEKGYDSKLGARPLRRVIQKYIEDPLAEIVLSNKVKTKLSIKLSKSGDELKII